MKNYGENNIENISEIVQLLNGIFKTVTGLKNIPKVKIEGDFKKEEIQHLVIYFSAYISNYISNDIESSELYISKNKKTGEIFIHENKTEKLVQSEKQVIFELITNISDREHILYLKEETNYLINVKTEVIKLIGFIEYNKDFDFGGINKDKIDFIKEFILNYDAELTDIRKDNKYINIFLYLFEEIINNHNTTLSIYEKEVLKSDVNGKHFYRNMKTEIFNFINKMIKENIKTKNDLK